VSRVMSINDAARHLGVCPDTVRRHVRLGLLPARQKPRGTKYQWLVEVPEGPTHTSLNSGSSEHGHGHPTAEEYERVRELADELRRMLDVATTELAARRQEVAVLLALLERTGAPAASVS
jgi:Helix-turn-helix domain